MDIAIYTLGCKANQYETQAMEAELVRRGHHLVDFDGPADAYIVNTCAVTPWSPLRRGPTPISSIPAPSPP